MKNIWFTRYGTEYTGPIIDVNPAKGYATYRHDRHCGRCGGAGRSDKWAYTGFTCFDCGGSGKHKNGPAILKAYTAEKLAQLDTAQAKAQVKRKAKKAAEAAERAAQAEIERDQKRAEAEAWKAAHFDLIAGIGRYSVDPEQGAGNFFNSMLEAFWKHGKLSERQLEAARSAVASEEAKCQTAFVGSVGERVELTVTVERVIPVGEGGMYGQRYINLCRDEHGNRIVYKGAGYSIPGEGHTCRIKATVDGHESFRGEKQTIISRPKRIEAAA